MKKESFEHKLLKGRIVETLFAQMLRETKNFTVLAFGYENVLPDLTRQQRDIHAEETMETIRRTPDFVVINNKSHEVYLIEVKYRMRPDSKDILKEAKRMATSWRPAYLFLATPKGFYFDTVSKIIKNNGAISKFHSDYVLSNLQAKYMEMLNEFIKPHGTSTRN